jgi:hypothetical protein
MGLGVIASVALEGIRAAAGPAAPAADGGQAGDKRIELGDVVDIGRRYLRDERDAARIGNEVMLGAHLAAIGWVRSSFFPRARRAPTRYRRPSTAGPGGRAGGVRRAALRATAARPPCVRGRSRDSPGESRPGRWPGRLLKLGVQDSQATVAKYMARPATPLLYCAIIRSGHDLQRYEVNHEAELISRSDLRTSAESWNTTPVSERC